MCVLVCVVCARVCVFGTWHRNSPLPRFRPGAVQAASPSTTSAAETAVAAAEAAAVAPPATSPTSPMVYADEDRTAEAVVHELVPMSPRPRLAVQPRVQVSDFRETFLFCSYFFILLLISISILFTLFIGNCQGPGTDSLPL